MSSNVGAWHSVKGGRYVVCFNKVVGIMGVNCVTLSAVLLWLVQLIDVVGNNRV